MLLQALASDTSRDGEDVGHRTGGRYWESKGIEIHLDLITWRGCLGHSVHWEMFFEPDLFPWAGHRFGNFISWKKRDEGKN